MKSTLYRLLFFFIVGLQLSCASILGFNPKQTTIDVYTSVPATVVIKNDTLKRASVYKNVTVNRNRNPLLISLLTDSTKHDFTILSIKSSLYNYYYGPDWMSFGISNWLIDKSKSKWYDYPSPIYLDIENNSYSKRIPKELIVNDNLKNTIKFTPLKLIDAVNPSIELTYERRTGKRFASQLMLSKLLSYNIYDMSRVKQQGVNYRVAFEEKYYEKGTAPKGRYYAIELDYLKNDYLDDILFATDIPDDNSFYGYKTYWDSVLIKKRLVSLNFKIGYQAYVNNFVFDSYIGLGLRYRYVRHFERINPNDRMQGPRHPNVHHLKNLPSKSLGISMPLNLRVGYSF